MEQIPSRLDSPPRFSTIYGRFYDRFDSEVAARVSGAAETVDYFG